MSSATALTLSQKHNILCLIAVPGTKAGPKRESGSIPELPAAVTGNEPCHRTKAAPFEGGLGSGMQ